MNLTAMVKQRPMRLFVRVVDAGSFTVVADQLNITTSVISKEVRRLEEELGVRLMHRSTRGQQLTAIGEGYLQRCRELLIQMEDAGAYVQHMQSNPQEKLRINAPMALGITDLSHLFSAYMTAYPDIELDIQLGDESQALGTMLSEQPNLEIDIQECVLGGGWEALEMDSIDLLMGAPSPVPLQKGFRTLPIPSADILLVVAADHPLGLVASNPQTIVEQLPNHRRIVIHYTARDNVLRNEGLTTGKQVLYVQNMEQKIQALRAGLGVSHLPRKLIQAHLDSGVLVKLTTDQPTTENLERYIAWKLSNKGRALKRLIQLLNEVVW